MSNQEIAIEYMVGEEKVKLTQNIVQQFIVGNDNGKITLQEFKFFTELCKARKLNPFLKEVYCIKYGNSPAQIVVGKDVMLKRAVLHPQYNGKETGIIVEKDGEITERKGCFKLPNETLVGGWAKVYRKDREYPEYMSVSFEEVAGKKRNGDLNSNWATKGATMVEKVAKVRALREAFVDEFAGMYEEEEFHQEAAVNLNNDKVVGEAVITEEEVKMDDL